MPWDTPEAHRDRENRVWTAIGAASGLDWLCITRDPELEATQAKNCGREWPSLLRLAATWLIYTFIPPYVLDLDYASEMGFMSCGIILVVMLVLGAIAAMIAFELEFLGGLTIAGFTSFPPWSWRCWQAFKWQPAGEDWYQCGPQSGDFTLFCICRFCLKSNVRSAGVADASGVLY